MTCEVCHDDEAFTTDYYGQQLCADCVQIERDTDWDEWEANKRQRIAESQEY